MTRRWWADLIVTLATLAGVLAWDLSGLDLPLSHQLADASGFAWRNAWITRGLLHDGGRWLSAVVLVGVVLGALRPRGGGPSRLARWWAVGVLLLGLTVVPLLKRGSLTSCAWDLTEFGGQAAYVPHWQFGVWDGGPGHCFPSGHAVAAFAYFALYFLWRPVHPARARAWLIGTLSVGLLFGTAQVLRGAHFASHVLWSAWICWTLAAAADAVFSRRRDRVRRPLPGGSRA